MGLKLVMENEGNLYPYSVRSSALVLCGRIGIWKEAGDSGFDNGWDMWYDYVDRPVGHNKTGSF